MHSPSPIVRMRHEGYFLRMPERGVHALTSRVTEDENLFLLAHMGLAEVDVDAWSLTVEGLITTQVSLTLADLKSMRQRDVMSVHECAGSPLTPTVPRRRVGNVIWSGVPLRDVLYQCGVKPEATFVWTHGLELGDFGDLKNEPYVKDLPLTKAFCPEVLLATSMNGLALRRDRGGPVRLVVPGWYGTNSVKWIGALTLSDRRAPGPYTTRFYNDPSPDGPLPVWGIAPESILVSPSPDQPPQAGEVVSIQGWAWAESGVAKVEVSTDAGRTWIQATLEPRRDFSWQYFSLSWTFPSGRHELSCRCFEFNGNGQPESGSRNAVHAIVIDVLASTHT